MNNVFVYCEIEGTKVAEVSQELLTKGRKLANQQGVELHAIVAGKDIKGKVEEQILPYGVDKLFVFDGEGLFPYTSAPHTDILVNLFKEEQPQIALMGATVIGRDLGPRGSGARRRVQGREPPVRDLPRRGRVLRPEDRLPSGRCYRKNLAVRYYSA